MFYTIQQDLDWPIKPNPSPYKIQSKGLLLTYILYKCGLNVSAFGCPVAIVIGGGKKQQPGGSYFMKVQMQSEFATNDLLKLKCAQLL